MTIALADDMRGRACGKRAESDFHCGYINTRRYGPALLELEQRTQLGHVTARRRSHAQFEAVRHFMISGCIMCQASQAFDFRPRVHKSRSWDRAGGAGA